MILFGCQSINRDTNKAIGNQIAAHTPKKVNTLNHDASNILSNLGSKKLSWLKKASLNQKICLLTINFLMRHFLHHQFVSGECAYSPALFQICRLLLNP